MATSRNGGLIALPDWFGGTRLHGVRRQAQVHGLGTVQAPQFSRAGGVHTLNFYGGTKAVTPPPPGPQVSNQNPAPGSTILPGDTVSFDVTDAAAFLFLEVQVDQGRREVVHDGDAFVDPYLTSIKVPISGGYRFQVRRSGGWVTSTATVFRVRAFDVLLAGG